MPLGSITQMYSLDVVAVAVAIGNVLFQKKIQRRKPMPGMSAPVLELLELFPLLSCLATSHLSPPFAPSASF